MKTIIHLVNILYGTVLVFGLMACSKDNPPAPSQPVWRVQEPQIEHEGRSMRLSLAAMKDQPIKTDDALVFTGGQDDKDLKGLLLTAHANCQTESTSLGEITQSWPLRSRFHLYEFMPLQALFDSAHPATQNIECSFHFEVANSEGSTHDFNVTFVHIGYGRGDLNILKDGNIAEPLDNSPIEIRQSQIAAYSLPMLENPTDQYGLLCENQSGYAKATPYAIAFSQFVLQKRGAAPSHSNHSNICRVLRLDRENRVTAISDLISWRLSEPDVRIEIVSPPDGLFTDVEQLGNRGVPNGTTQNIRSADSFYKIINMGGETAHVILPAGDAQTFEAKVYIVGADVYLPLLLRSHALVFKTFVDATQLINATVTFDIQPGQSLLMELGPSLDLRSCPGRNLMAAFDLSPHSENGLLAYLVDDVKVGPTVTNVIATIRLEAKYTRRFSPAWVQVPATESTAHPVNIGCANEIAAVDKSTAETPADSK